MLIGLQCYIVKVKLEKSMKRLRVEADTLAEKAVKENKMSLVVESNALRNRALELEKDVEASAAKIRKIEEESNSK